MISGALEMSAKKVEDIMTLLDDVYSIPLETFLDYETIHDIISSGKVPVVIYFNNLSDLIHVCICLYFTFIIVSIILSFSVGTYIFYAKMCL